MTAPAHTPQVEPGRLGLLVTPVMLLVTLSMVILRLPPFLLDILFSFNIAFALILLTLSLHIKRPLEFSVFPTLLLMATLLRLALNIASTRIVLLQGHEGTGAAGKVIESFGKVVIAGNYFVGLLVFIILVIVNFVVITKGGSRISEVSARFTLDAMPGKQMAIDADLNSGVIHHEEAKTRREEVTREADFYGAMDGASKFVRGDAVAGLLILLINIAGGLCIGIWQHNMEIQEALRTYTLLTVGDGLVTQVPSLLMSTTAAIMVTRVSKAKNIHSQFRQEVMSHPQAIVVAASVLIIIGLAPGMPHLAFIGLGFLLCVMAYRAFSREKQATGPGEAGSESTAPEATLGWNDIPLADPLGLDIGYRLISLLEESGEGKLMDKIRDLREELSRQYGFLVPMVHIRDNLELHPESYAILLHNIEYARFEVKTGLLLAISTGDDTRLPDGIKTQEPSYGLEAAWIQHEQRSEAVQAGCTVVDCSTVITTHIGAVIEQNISELIGFEETRLWLENLRKESPRLCDDLVPEKFSLGQLMQILKGLLADKVAIYDALKIASTLLESPGPEKNRFLILQQARVALRRQITHRLQENQATPGSLSVFTLSSELEKILLVSREQAKHGDDFSEDSFPIEPSLSQQLQKGMQELQANARNQGVSPVLLVAAQLWPLLARYARSLPGEPLAVLTYQEIPDRLQVEIIGQMG